MQQNDGCRCGFFNRSWAEFKVGFGNPGGNYWLGNDMLSQVTRKSGRYKLRIDLQSCNNDKWYYAEYRKFKVLSEAHNYKIQVSGYSGNVGRDELSFINGVGFTTYDRDNDGLPHKNDDPPFNCAAHRGAGYWHRWCGMSCLNGACCRGKFFWWSLQLSDGGARGRLQKSRMWLLCK